MDTNYEKLRSSAIAARVPDSDRNGPGSEPVTISAWYDVPTVSGREAFAYFAWHGGIVRETCCTYDIAAERALRDAEVDDWIRRDG